MTRSARLLVALALNLALVGGLAYVGVTAHSLGVLAAGVDYLADAAAIGVAVIAIRLTARFPKANALAAAVNAGWLFVLSLLVIATGIERLVARTPAVHGLPVLVMSALAAVVMIGAVLVLGVDFDGDDDSDEGLSHKAVLLDTAADAASALGVATAGAVILATGGFDWLDPAVALAIAAVVDWHAYALLREARSSLRGERRAFAP
ncbi:MAG TPA: cation transporter [Acidimicrobiales bacterium]|nr:cation transporter [Acidimicrobiales bacterium]